MQKSKGNIVAVHMSLIPGTDKYFFMERPSGRHPDRSNNIVGYYDLKANRFTNVIYTDSVFCAGHTVTQVGGWVFVRFLALSRDCLAYQSRWGHVTSRRDPEASQSLAVHRTVISWWWVVTSPRQATATA